MDWKRVGIIATDICYMCGIVLIGMATVWFGWGGSTP
jgi:hypothetical protein